MESLQNSLETVQAYPNILQLIGIVGFLTYVIFFGLVQNEKICGNGMLYPASKVFAATCVLISLVGAFNLASCMIQLSYIAIGSYGLAVRRRKFRSNSPLKPQEIRTQSSKNVVRLTSKTTRNIPENELDPCGQCRPGLLKT